jgi:hypothetical protein
MNLGDTRNKEQVSFEWKFLLNIPNQRFLLPKRSKSSTLILTVQKNKDEIKKMMAV